MSSFILFLQVFLQTLYCQYLPCIVSMSCFSIRNCKNILAQMHTIYIEQIHTIYIDLLSSKYRLKHDPTRMSYNPHCQRIPLWRGRHRSLKIVWSTWVKRCLWKKEDKMAFVVWRTSWEREQRENFTNSADVFRDYPQKNNLVIYSYEDKKKIEGVLSTKVNFTIVSKNLAFLLGMSKRLCRSHKPIRMFKT